MTGITRPGCADPCRDLTFVSTAPKTYTFDINVKVKGGAQINSNMVTVILECGPNSAYFT